MKVLWFEVTIPSRYKNNGIVVGGWQDSLENIVRDIPEIELFISFETDDSSATRMIVGNVTYIPILKKQNFSSKIRRMISYAQRVVDLKVEMEKIVNEVSPDIIHVFGTEWPFGHVAELTDIPVIIHIMGAMIPYTNALYAPGYSLRDLIRTYPFWKMKKRLNVLLGNRYSLLRALDERKIWENVKNYMGRTEWDCALSKVLSPERRYFHVEEALRREFMESEKVWENTCKSKIQLISTGCSSFWKGPDMLLKTAMILKERDVDFEWIVAGRMNEWIKKAVERKLKTTYERNNVKLIGFTKPSDLKRLLCKSTMYVHTAYVENSPNSICEAQILGVPVVSTYVGGIPTLLGNAGIMIPANDPWQMANAIMELAADKDKLEKFSKQGREMALKRHNPDNIKKQLMECYNGILNCNSK